MGRKTLLLLIAMGLAQAWVVSQSKARRRRLHDALASRAAPTVQTWEGEGGALPLTGAQLGPDPSLPQVIPTGIESLGQDG